MDSRAPADIQDQGDIRALAVDTQALVDIPVPAVVRNQILWVVPVPAVHNQAQSVVPALAVDSRAVVDSRPAARPGVVVDVAAVASLVVSTRPPPPRYRGG